MLLLLVLLATLPLHAQPDRFGLPGCPAPFARLAARAGFLVCFDLQAQLPRWTAHQIARSPHTLRRPAFRRDLDLAPNLSPRLYSSTPYVRGHLVPAADVTASAAAFLDSFLMSNVASQDPALNSGLLLRIENAIRRLSQIAEAVLVITGTLFDPPSDSAQPAIPSHLFKAVLVVRHTRMEMYAVLVPNAPPHPARGTRGLRHCRKAPTENTTPVSRRWQNELLRRRFHPAPGSRFAAAFAHQAWPTSLISFGPPWRVDSSPSSLRLGIFGCPGGSGAWRRP